MSNQEKETYDKLELEYERIVKMLKVVFYSTEDEEQDTGYVLVLDEVKILMETLKKEYGVFKNKKEIRELIRKTHLLKEKINAKIVLRQSKEEKNRLR